MSNVIYPDTIYNENVKREFMSQYEEDTQNNLSRMFKISSMKETELKRDLFDFNREQIRALMFLYRPTTEYSSRQNISWVSKYIDWAIEEGHLTGTNPLVGISKEWKDQFVNKTLKKYWTDNELSRIMEKCANSQDAVIISLLKNGVGGKGHSEILNLTKKDVDAFNNKLHLIDDDGNKRTIEVDDECIKLCEAALRDITYEKMNGNASPDNRSDEGNLIDNEFVVRSMNTNTTHMYEAEKNIVYRRLSNIAETLGEVNFVPRNIQYSGMLVMAKNLYVKNGKLDQEEYKVICKQFNITSDQSLYRLKNEFLDVDTIKELYDL